MTSPGKPSCHIVIDLYDVHVSFLAAQRFTVQVMEMIKSDAPLSKKICISSLRW